ncbi:MAG: pitrilysin family protein [Candidatus Taylorbacteria bacterium]
MKFKRKVLKNGVRVVTVNLKDNPTVTVLVMVEAGSKYETKPENGISHFLEHMCFKGTKNRPKAIDIVRELDSVGAQYNAFTSQEFTGYYAKSNPKHVGKILDVVSDLYLNPLLPVEEIEKEKGVIVDEIAMYEDLPMQEVHNVFEELLYGDQPAGWKITGSKETVRAVTREKLLTYRSRHYVPVATTIIVSGNFNEGKILEDINSKFGSIPGNKKHDKLKVKESQSGPALKLEYKKTDQSHIILGVRAFNTYDKKNAILRVLSAVLGGGMSSRLFQKLRDQMGIGYYVQASTDASTDHGQFSVAIGTDVSKVEKAIVAILEELKRMKEELVPASELQKAKDYLIGNMHLSLETSDSLAEFYGLREIMRKELITPDELGEEVKKITSAQIKKVAREIFDNSKLNLAIIGPLDDEKKLKSLLKID